MTPNQVVESKIDGLAEMIGAVHESVEARQVDVDAIRIAVRDGIVAAASDREVWKLALDTLVPVARQHAQAEAGSWLLGGMKAFFSRLAWVVVIGMGIYLVGGWSALVAFFKHGTVPWT
jgi:uncharacterized membrane protein YdbT with pleckstrin-like domain